MEGNFWDYSELIEATKEEKEGHLKYEILMFQKTCDYLDLNSKTQFERNLLLESLATHARILIEFFYGKKKFNKY